MSDLFFPVPGLPHKSGGEKLVTGSYSGGAISVDYKRPWSYRSNPVPEKLCPGGSNLPVGEPRFGKNPPCNGGWANASQR